MKPNPYAWQSHHPSHAIPRQTALEEIAKHVRHGRAVKVVGGRGAGKSVLLQQVEAHLRGEPGTRVVLVPSRPEQTTVVGAVQDLAAKMGIHALSPPRLDAVLERVLQNDVTRLVLLLDEADQYVGLEGRGASKDAFARAWFNKLEATRRTWGEQFGVVFAGGLGLVFLERELGSAIVGRAEPFLLEPFTAAEIAALAVPFEEDSRPLDDRCLETLLVLSGGIPALVTYGLEHLWSADVASVEAVMLERIFGEFRERYDAFVRAIFNSISDRGRLDAPRRVLEIVRRDAGAVSLQQLRGACAPDDPTLIIDPKQALDLLRAAGLVRIEGSALADPVAAWPIASILNFPETPARSGEPIERLLQDVSAVLANLHRFGRDFRDNDGLFHEDLYSSLIAVGLRLLGWLETDREATQAAGFTDVKVRLVTRPNLGGHVIIETKIWRNKDYNKGIQKQIDDYRISETRHAIAVTLGARGAAGWPEDYEQTCLAGLAFERLEAPPDVVGRWRVRTTHQDGREKISDHLLVQIPKRR